MKNLYFILFIFIITINCKNKQNNIKDNKEEHTIEKNQKSKSEDVQKYVPQSVDEDLANNLRNFLINDYLKKDISGMDKKDRKFQFYKVDLNADGNDEIFVRFLTPYFVVQVDVLFYFWINMEKL